RLEKPAEALTVGRLAEVPVPSALDGLLVQALLDPLQAQSWKRLATPSLRSRSCWRRSSAVIRLHPARTQSSSGTLTPCVEGSGSSVPAGSTQRLMSSPLR